MHPCATAELCLTKQSFFETGTLPDRSGQAYATTLYFTRDAIEQLASIDDPSGAVGRVRKPPDDR